MLIRSNRSFQDGGNGETIMPEESRPLKVPERINGGWKHTVGCQKSLPFFPPAPFFLTLSLYFSFLLSLPLMTVN